MAIRKKIRILHCVQNDRQFFINYRLNLIGWDFYPSVTCGDTSLVRGRLPSGVPVIPHPSRLRRATCTLAVPKIFCGIRLEYFDRGASSRQDSLFSEHRFAVFLSRLSASPLPQKNCVFRGPFLFSLFRPLGALRRLCSLGRLPSGIPVCGGSRCPECKARRNTLGVPPPYCKLVAFAERSGPFPAAAQKTGGCKKRRFGMKRLFLYAVFEFYFCIRRYGIFRKFRKKLRDFFRVLQKGKFFCLFKALYTVFQFSGGGFAIAKPKTGNTADLVAFCIFCRRFKPVIMGINPALYIIGKACIKGIIAAQKGIYPKHQISRTARTFPSSLASPTTNPAFLKSLFARLISREYAAQSFFASPRGYSFTILIASCNAAVP